MKIIDELAKNDTPMKKAVNGALKGSVGTDLKAMLDKNGDGKITWDEIKNTTLDEWINFLISTGTTIISLYVGYKLIGG